MKVRNNYTTTIGVGSMAILPDAVVDLPEKYGKSHPVIAYYLSRKWLVEVGAETAAPVGLPPVNVTIGNPAGNGEGKTGENGGNPGENGNVNPDGGAVNDEKTDETGGATGEVKTDNQEQIPAEGTNKKKK